MATPMRSDKEHPSTYVVSDRSNRDEMTRLQIQDRIVTAGMGGVLPEQPASRQFQRILDVGCGTGGWLLEAARTYPDSPVLIGVDVSNTMLEFAREQATREQVSNRVEFHIMDALRRLEFPIGYFDLVNLRFGLSYLRKWDWPKLLQEFQRIVRPGGIVRITEADMISRSNSPAHQQLQQLLVQTFYQAGHFFSPTSDGVISHLEQLLRQHGLSEVKTHAYVLEYRAGTDEGQLFIDDVKYAFRTVVPFLHKWTRVPDDYNAIYQHMLDEMQQPDFFATWNLLTAWGVKW